MTKTPIEQAALNPHQLTEGDLVILPDGTAAIITGAGFRWAKFEDAPPCLLSQLRPYSNTEAGRNRIEQLSLLRPCPRPYLGSYLDPALVVTTPPPRCKAGEGPKLHHDLV